MSWFLKNRLERKLHPSKTSSHGNLVFFTNLRRIMLTFQSSNLILGERLLNYPYYSTGLKNISSLLIQECSDCLVLDRGSWPRLVIVKVPIPKTLKSGSIINSVET
jgi:hypothetical protein